MYSFAKDVIGDFTVFKSSQHSGDTHRKQFGNGVSPSNQSTLNLYIDGEFELFSDGYTQLLTAGMTSLDVALEQYPPGVIFTERVLSETGLRYCVSRNSAGAWNRSILSDPQGHVLSHKSLLITLQGEISGLKAGEYLELPAGMALSGLGKAVCCWASS